MRATRDTRDTRDQRDQRDTRASRAMRALRRLQFLRALGALRRQQARRALRVSRVARAALREKARLVWLRHAPRSFALRSRPSPQELGLAGEELSARALRARGFRLLGRRLYTPSAEVDLWAMRDGVSWAVEVKTGRCARLPGLRGGPGPRWDLRWRPSLSLGPEQHRRLARAARYLGSLGHHPHGVLLVEVFVDPSSRTLELREPVQLQPPMNRRSGLASPWP